jgi:hypothetical protein
LEGYLAPKWKSYVEKLVSNFIKVKEEEEETLSWSKNVATGEYTTKLEYAEIMEASIIGDK